MKRRTFLRGGLAGTALGVVSPALGLLQGEKKVEESNSAVTVQPFEFGETTIADLQAAMRSGKHSSRSITQAYLERIDALDKQSASLNCVIELNPDALAIAESLDKGTTGRSRTRATPRHSHPYQGQH
jgi:amidase